jgi:hypothetical protein
MNPLIPIILQLIAQYGIPGFFQILDAINKTTITEADIAKLRDIKPPEFYFPVKA